MTLSKEAIEEFKKIYSRVFNEELTDQEATEKANRTYDLHKAFFDFLSSGSSEKVNQNESRSVNK